MKNVLIAVALAATSAAPLSRKARRLRRRSKPARISLAIVTLPAMSDEFKEIDVMSGGWPDGGDIPFKYTQYEGNEFPGLELDGGS